MILHNHIEAYGYLGIGGIFVPDTLGLYTTLLRFYDNYEANYISVIGVMLLYYPAAIFNFEGSRIVVIIINLSLIYFSICYFRKSLYFISDINVNYYVNIVTFLMLSNFYVLASIPYPGKEIPLIFLTNIYIYYIVFKKKYIYSIFLLPAILIFRDGYGFIMALLTLFLYLIDFNIKYKNIIIFYFIISLFLNVRLLADVFSDTELAIIFKRNEDYSVELGSFLDNLPNYVSYILKIINNLFSAALRPQLFDLNYRFYFVGFGLWIAGVISMLGISIPIFKISNEKNIYFAKIYFAIIFILLSISYSLYTQPRYLFPFFYWYIFLILLFFSRRKLLLILILIINIVIFFNIFGIGAPVGLGVDSLNGFNIKK